MAQFLAVTSRGLHSVLHDELKRLGCQRIWKSGDSLRLECSWAELYRLSLQVKTATRFLLPVLDFVAYTPEDLYGNARKHDFTKYIDVKDTFCIRASVRSRIFHSQRFAAMKLKDVIADQFRDIHGERPDVDVENPDLTVQLKIIDEKVSLAVDLSGAPLSHRGYRKDKGAAPLKEHLAAGLLHLAGWQENVPLIDPMCGSGTFLIEAAYLHSTKHPLPQRDFAFKHLSQFDQDKLAPLVEASRQTILNSKLKLYGFDKDPNVIEIARLNARKAGVESMIHFEVADIKNLRSPVRGKGMIVCNPPYGIRLSDEKRLASLYETFGQTLKKQFPGWDAFILSGNPEVTKHLKMKSTQKFPVANGPIDCRWIHYQISDHTHEKQDTAHQ